MPVSQPRFKVGDRVILDSGDYRFADREFTVREITHGKYQLSPASGQGNGVKDVAADMLLAPGEPLKSTRWFRLGVTIRYTGTKVVKHKTTVILAPGDLGVVIAGKARPGGDLVMNVARLGGLDQDAYARLSPRHLEIVPLDELAGLLAAAATA